MPKQPSDTHPEAEAYQISLMRKASVSQRISMALSLSQTVINLSKRAIKRANPKLNQKELNLLFVATHYGSDLSDRLRAHWDREGK